MINKVRKKRVLVAVLTMSLCANLTVNVVAAEITTTTNQPVVQQADDGFTTFFEVSQRMQTEYQLSKYDVINIAIIGFDESNFKDILIGPDGYVNLPYAGTVKLVGLTVPEATILLKEKLGEYIRIPDMAVMVKQYGVRQVYVMGEVTNQGIYTLTSDYMNVFAALSSAGGVKKKGRPKHIAVVRMVEGQVRMKEIDFDCFVKNQDHTQNIVLQDGDMIYVPKSKKIDLQEDIMPIVSAVGLFRTLTR